MDHAPQFKHSLADWDMVHFMGADALVLAIVPVAQGGADGITVLPSSALVASVAGKEYGTQVQMPLCEDGQIDTEGTHVNTVGYLQGVGLWHPCIFCATLLFF